MGGVEMHMKVAKDGIEKEVEEITIRDEKVEIERWLFR